MRKNGKSVDELERAIPDRVDWALRSAYKSAIKTGYFVVIARRGKIIRIDRDLKTEVLGHTGKSFRVKKGTRIKLA